MLIKINDNIKVGPLEGTITSISIGVTQGDPAGELGPKAVLAQIQTDVEHGDMTAIAELIETLATEQMSRQVLNDYIGEESQ